MANQHDNNFKQLMAERSFFEPFIKTYLPPELLNRIDWESVSLYKMGGSHIEENTQKEFEADVIYLAKLDGRDAFLWLHCEHQGAPDKMIVLRVINYQSAELLSYAKQNPGKDLPAIVTLIYHQGEKPWPYSLNIADLFAEPELAMKYFAKPILIDLPSISDEELKRHRNIGSVEMVLKYIRRKDFGQRMQMVMSELHTVDDNSRKIVIRYLIQVADVSEAELFETAKKCLPQDKELIMTVAEQIGKRYFHEGMEQGVQQGMERGVQQGMEQGMELEKFQIAKNMLEEGFSLQVVERTTKISHDLMLKLKRETQH